MEKQIRDALHKLKSDAYNISVNITSIPYNAKNDGNDITSILEKIKTDFPLYNVELWFPRGEYSIQSNFTCPSTWALRFFDGAALNVDSGKTFNFNNCKLIANENSYIFKGGTGTYTGSIQNDKIYPQWFGFKGDYLPGREEIISLAITNKCTSDGNITIKIRDISVTVSLTSASQTSTDLVAKKIYLAMIQHSTLYKYWNTQLFPMVGAAPATIILSSTDKGFKVGSTTNDFSTTGVTGTSSYWQYGKDGYANYNTKNIVSVTSSTIVVNTPASTGGGTSGNYYQSKGSYTNLDLSIEDYSNTSKWEDITAKCGTDDWEPLNKSLNICKAKSESNLIIRGSACKISDQLNMQAQKCTIDLYCGMYLKKAFYDTFHVANCNVFYVKNEDASKPLYDFTLNGHGNIIDGNKNGISGYVYSPDGTTIGDTANDCLLLWNCRNAKIRDVVTRNGLVDCIVIGASQNTEIHNCEAWNSGNDNGISIAGYNNGGTTIGCVYGITFNEIDPQTWSNTKVTKCKAFYCVDLGFTSIRGVGVTFEDCISYRCGTYYETSGQFNKGGGYSFEMPDMSYVSANVIFNRCEAKECVGRGFYMDGSKGKLSKCIVDTVYSAGNLTTMTEAQKREYGGNGVTLWCNRHDIDLEVDIRWADNFGVNYLSGGSGLEMFNFWMRNCKFEHCGSDTLNFYGVGQNWNILDTYIKQGTRGIYVYNNSAAFNQGGGIINVKNITFDSTYSAPWYTEGLGTILIDGFDMINCALATYAITALGPSDNSIMPGSIFNIDNFRNIKPQGGTTNYRISGYDMVDIGVTKSDLIIDGAYNIKTIKRHAPYFIGGSKTFDPPSIANGGNTTTTVTVTGAVVGDKCPDPNFSLPYQGLKFSGQVTSTDTVTVTITNNTGSAIDLGSGTLKAWVKKDV